MLMQASGKYRIGIVYFDQLSILVHIKASRTTLLAVFAQFSTFLTILCTMCYHTCEMAYQLLLCLNHLNSSQQCNKQHFTLSMLYLSSYHLGITTLRLSQERIKNRLYIPNLNLLPPTSSTVASLVGTNASTTLPLVLECLHNEVTIQLESFGPKIQQHTYAWKSRYQFFSEVKVS